MHGPSPAGRREPQISAGRGVLERGGAPALRASPPWGGEWEGAGVWGLGLAGFLRKRVGGRGRLVLRVA